MTSQTTITESEISYKLISICKDPMRPSKRYSESIEAPNTVTIPIMLRTKTWKHAMKGINAKYSIDKHEC